MSAESLSFLPASRLAVVEPVLSAPTTHAPPAVPDDMVVVPRHVADAAYHLLQAAHALKGNGGNQLFAALATALDKGKHRKQLEHPPACDCCHAEVGQGFPHHVECWSEEAVRYRALPIPAVDLPS